MTNRKWLVERDELEAGDILDMPIPVPTESALSKAEQIQFEQIAAKNDEKCRNLPLSRWAVRIHGSEITFSQI